MTKQIIINEANSLLHRKSKELSKSIIKTPKDLERFAIGLDKLSKICGTIKTNWRRSNEYFCWR